MMKALPLSSRVNSCPNRKRLLHSSISPCRVGGTTMSTYTSSECRRVSPSVHGNTFATAHRKKAVANIFDNAVPEDGRHEAEERVRSIFSYTQDPEETKRALMALKQRKKDKFLQIAGMLRHLLQMR
ncbi:hypothetical protein F7725_012230 [Dissostichus mawsoni]|uniref:Arginine vasopressin-induced protein 1/transcriptional and immune response regulator domain-containing protein n=1 Tax=Dissostichus mawsoni TaxID=36200 RepID=A0A7J5YQA5_DISMA|nr:hypothetical protein F7725_012230 [Dissostichus mawsoni]